MKNLLKSALSLILLLSILISLCSCSVFLGVSNAKKNDVTINGVSYVFFNDTYVIEEIRDFENSPDAIALIIPDYLNGYEVDVVGDIDFMAFEPMHISCKKAERIYFPWTISVCNPVQVVEEYSDESTLKYVFSCTNVTCIGAEDGHIPKIGRQRYYVITRWLYDKLIEKKPTFEARFKYYLSANIAYFFNYEDNPNEGYFFIDLMDESGKIVKPPYDPRREGYTFSGWYKDEACTEAWDFENDTVTILFDENGNRIYEEIKLYAKWYERW